MLNLPGDTRTSTERTIRFIKELKLDLVNVQITYPWPHTPLWDHVTRHYQVVSSKLEDWRSCAGSTVTFTQSDLTIEYIETAYGRIIREFYLNPRFILRWLTRLRSYHDLKYSFLQFISLCSRFALGSRRG